MEILDVIKNRFSVRSYQQKQVSQAEIDQLLEAAKHAPTAKNKQPWHIYVLQSSEAMEKLNAHCRCVFGAPQAFLISYHKEQAWQSPFNKEYQSGEMDASIIADEIMLTATSMGLGTCWVGYFDHNEIAEVFGLAADEVPAVIMLFGYPAEDAAPIAMHSTFKPMEEMVTYL